MKTIEKYIKAQKLPSINSSVHFGDNTRFNKAKEQSTIKPTDIQKIINLTNKFLEIMGMDAIKNPILDNQRITELCNQNIYIDENIYKNIQLENNLKDIRDIVWMKFTKDGYLGVVATSNDINFNIPLSIDGYNDTTDGLIKTKFNYWKYNTSGIIIHHLQKEWNRDFVLVFPLINIPDSLVRSDVECGIGNYLIENGVPILDYYSHNF